jgi:cyclophilin family peptidyl-prolyl cis-trans isomerase
MTSKYLLFIFWLCVSTVAKSQNIFSNNITLQQVYTHTYNRMGTEILPYFNSNNPLVKKQAYLAFASIQDSVTIAHLFEEMDKNKEDTLLKYLVYSIGQTKCKASFVGLLQRLNNVNNTEAYHFMVEAIGKSSLFDLTSIFTQLYEKNQHKNAAFIRYWTRGLYHAQRNKHVQVQDSELLIIYETLLKDTTLFEETQKLLANIFHKPAPKVATAHTKTIESFEEINTMIANNPNIYEQTKQLQSSNLTSNICAQILYSDLPPLLKYTALNHDLSKNSPHSERGNMLHKALWSGDVSLISLVCTHLQNTKGKDAIQDTITVAELLQIKDELKLPRDLETWLDLEKTIHTLQNQVYEQKSFFDQGYENPLDWDYIQQLSVGEKVRIQTTKGMIILKLHVEEAPASVAHFLKLVDSGYYNQKYFHRVVPNFVIQGGCPRGDGWGALDWIQRSEFSYTQSYKPGSIGLASAGKDTEGVQFFITHTYTTNLDGKYTLFGQVEDGLDIVNSISIGDKIIDIIRL